MKRLIASGVFMMLMASALYASDNRKEPVYFSKGLYLSAEFCPGGLAFNDRNADRERNTSYGTDITVGYRFLPQLALAFGVGAHSYSNRTLTCGDTVLRKVENTCVPVFVRIRSDFRDREVTPYLQADFGYSFMDVYTRNDMGRVRYSDDRFTNGRFEYIEMNDSYIQYGMRGCFASVDFGIGIHMIGPVRMIMGLSAGFHQAFFGTSFLMEDGSVLDFGRADYLCSGEVPVQVRTVGAPDFKETLEPFVRVKIGISF